MFMTEIPLQPDEQCLARKGDPAHDGYAALVASVRDAVVDPRWQGETDVELVAQTLWAGVHGLTSMIVTMKDDPWIEWRSEADRVELLVQAMMEGLMRTKVAAAPAGATAAGAGRARARARAAPSWAIPWTSPPTAAWSTTIPPSWFSPPGPGRRWPR
jgi:hypothetical protein